MTESTVLVLMLVVAVCAFLTGKMCEAWAWREAARAHQRHCSGGKSFVVQEEAWSPDDDPEVYGSLRAEPSRPGRGVRC
jgi:hypothetical protein